MLIFFAVTLHLINRNNQTTGVHAPSFLINCNKKQNGKQKGIDI